MLLSLQTQTVATVAGILFDRTNHGVEAGSGYISGVVDHLTILPFSEKMLLNFKPTTAPTVGSLKVRLWREELSGFSFDSTLAGTYVEGVTFPTPYGYAPIIAEINYAEMVSGVTPIQFIREIDLGAFFNKIIPNRYRIIFENTTNARILSKDLRANSLLATIQAVYVQAEI